MRMKTAALIRLRTAPAPRLAAALAAELVHAYDAMPDGELGKGLTNGHFLRARPLVVPNAPDQADAA